MGASAMMGGLFAVDLESAGADVDMYALGLLPGFVEIIRENTDCDRERPDNQEQQVAIDRHAASWNGVSLTVVAGARFSKQAASSPKV
jgi:hypothetical protein